MNVFYNELLHFLQLENKEKSLSYCMNLLSEKKVTVVELYEQILRPALNNIIAEYPDNDDLIWREHVRSGIVRTIIEAAYPYVVEEAKQSEQKERVIVMCPEYEHHELGARIVSDFFTIAGYNSVFIGALTPLHTLLKAIDIIKPKYLSMSVTNTYHLTTTKATIEAVKEYVNEEMIFLVGGSAFSINPTVYQDVGGDFLLHTYEDIKNLHKEVQ